MHRIVKAFQRYIIYILLFFMGVVIIISTYEMIIMLINEIIKPLPGTGLILGTTGLIAFHLFIFKLNNASK